MNKKNIYKLISFTIIMSMFSLGTLFDDKDIIVKVLRLTNSALLSYMLIDVFFNMSSNRKNKYKPSKKLSIINLLWAITFIISNTIEYGTVFKLLNILALIVAGTTVYDLFVKREDREQNKEDIFKFGYLWIGFILLIPIILIFVLIGY